jgi:hypothetical protein
VGRSYPPEFYNWIKKPLVRTLFEKLAIETEEDYQNIIKKLEEFGVKVLRPTLAKNTFVNGKYVKPPMTPRDYTGMFGTDFYEAYSTNFMKASYLDIKDTDWPDCNDWNEFNQLPEHIQQECKDNYNFGVAQTQHTEYDQIIDHIKKQGNVVHSGKFHANTACCMRIGKDLFWGTESYNEEFSKIKKNINKEFPNFKNHIVNTGGHSDSTYCPV